MIRGVTDQQNGNGEGREIYTPKELSKVLYTKIKHDLDRNQET